jgi:hypothetical protein
MMNRRLTLTIATLVMFHFAVLAQVNLPLNSDGKIEIVDVVKVDSADKEELFERASEWASTFAAPDDKVTITDRDSVNGRIVCQVAFPVYTQSGILKKMTGMVSYTLSLEVKESKYRYLYTGLLYHYYKPNRNYELVATGKTKPLEDAEASGWQKTWMQTKSSTQARINSEIGSIKIKMKQKRNEPSLVKAETKKLDW